MKWRTNSESCTNRVSTIFRSMLLAVFFAFAVLFSAPADGAVIFQDNFDNAPDGARTGGIVPAGWSQWMQDGISATLDGITHYAGEITTPGRGGSGKSLKLWRHSTAWVGSASYAGPLVYEFPSSSAYSDIYIRWYMKLPVALDCTGSVDYLKLFRLNITGGTGEIYLNINNVTGVGSMRANGEVRVLGAAWQTVLSNSDLRAVWDGNWHCWEMRFGINSSRLTLWIDGVQKYNSSSFNYGAANAGRFTMMQHFPVGNAGVSQWQASWQALEVDDLVIADAYVGPDGSAPAPSPAPPPAPEPTPTGILFQEGFDDNNFASRGWFDDTSVDIDTSTKYSGTGSLRLTWGAGQTNPPLVAAMRKDFTATDTLYISMYWRFNSNWVGSGASYHPHLIYILSDLDDRWGGLAQNYLDTYIEVSNLTPRMIIQDGMNVNYSYGALPNNLTATTENRDVAGCNGCLAGSDCGDSVACYAVGGGTYWNGRFWNGSRNFNLNTWHKVEVYLKMNSISSGRAVADGIMWMKVDGNYVINKTKMVFRTNQRPTMKWRTFVIAPWIGDGSPQTQTMWIDNLTVATSAATEPNPPAAAPSAPSGLRIISN